jgi:hypothetical protein
MAKKRGPVVADRAFESFGRGCLKGRVQMVQRRILCKCEKGKVCCRICNWLRCTGRTTDFRALVGGTLTNAACHLPQAQLAMLRCSNAIRR